MKRNTGYMQMLKDNRMLVMTILTVLGLVAMDRLSLAPLSQSKATLMISIFTIVVFFVAWLLDVLALGRGRPISPRELKLAVCDDLQALEVPFMLRIARYPHPASEFDTRFAQIIEASRYWDWTFYRVSGSREINQALLGEIDAAYLSRKGSTSSFGLIMGAWDFPSDLIIVGSVHSDTPGLPFLPHPWEIGERGGVQLRPAKAYMYYVRSETPPSLMSCSVIDSAAAVASLFKTVIERLSEARKEMLVWGSGTDQEWSERIESQRERIREDLRKAFESAPHVTLGRLTHRAVLSWMVAQPKPIFLAAVVGYTLSPFSPYNDPFVNIPLSVFMARVTHDFLGVNEAFLSGVFYVLSNILGLLLLAYAFRRLLPKARLRFRLTARQWFLAGAYIGVAILASMFLKDVLSAIARLVQSAVR